MNAADYLRSRGIVDKDLVVRVRAEVEGGRCWFPWLDREGKVRYYSGRSLSGRWPKYQNSRGARPPLFASPGAWEADRVALVEGAVDALACAQAGMPGFATMGATLLPAAVGILAVKQEVVMVADRDDAGARWRDDVAEKLRGKVPLLEVQLPEGMKDAAELAESAVTGGVLMRTAIEAVVGGFPGAEIVDNAPGDPAQVLAALLAGARPCSPPGGRPGGAPGPEDGQPLAKVVTLRSRASSGNHGHLREPTPVVTRMSDVAWQPISWLWPGRLPRGKLVLVEGDPGLGKSSVLLDLAARISTGSPMPDGARLKAPAAVVILTAEDALPDTVRPRLEAAGADLKRIFVLEAFTDEGGLRLPDLPGDVPALQQIAEEHKPALIVVDPLSAYLGSEVNSWRDHDVRRALAPLSALAEGVKAAVVTVRHLTKGGGTNPLYRGGGSIGIIGAARLSLLVAVDPQDETRRVLAVSKSNLAEIPAALAYRLLADERLPVARVAWEGPTDHTAAGLLALPEAEEERSAVAEAMELLENRLSNGPLAVRQVFKETEAAGIADKTVRRAKERLGIKARKVGAPGGSEQHWVWELSPRGPALDPPDQP